MQPFICHLRPFTQVLCCLCALFLLPLSAVNAQPAVHEIEVFADITGTSPQDAKDRALDYAQKRAFFLLLNDLAPDQRDALVQTMEAEQMLAQVRGYTILRERILEEQNRYQAQIVVSFADAQIQRLLGAQEEDVVTETPPEEKQALLIIPVLDNGQGLLLWDGANVWRSIWNSVALEKGAGTLVMPYGDPRDVASVDHTTILSRSYFDLEPMLERYGAKQAVVALATYVLDREPIAVEVTVRRMGETTDQVKDFAFTAENKDTTPQLLLIRASKVIADQLKQVTIEDEKKAKDALDKAKQTRLKAMFTRLPDWVQLQQQLANLPKVAEVEVSNITINSADVTLYHNSTDELLQRSMQAYGIRVMPMEGAPWRVSMR